MVTVRKTRGDDIDAACGQLAGQVVDKSQRRKPFRDAGGRLTIRRQRGVAVKPLKIDGRHCRSMCTGRLRVADPVETKLPDQSAPSDPAFRAKLHTERASEYFKVGSYGIAIEAAQTAIQHVPGYAPAHNMLGVIHMQLKQDDKAQQAFEQAIRFAPAGSGKC